MESVATQSTQLSSPFSVRVESITPRFVSVEAWPVAREATAKPNLSHVTPATFPLSGACPFSTFIQQQLEQQKTATNRLKKARTISQT